MLKIAVVHDGEAYQQRVREYLQSQHAAKVTQFEVPSNLPVLMDEDDAAQIIPQQVGEADLVIAISLHPALLAELPHVMGSGQTKALLVPQEHPTWVRPGVVRQVTRDCARYEMESAFPKPFCALQPRTPVITRFCEQYRAGKPSFHITCEDQNITQATCTRSSPCGLAAWTAKQLPGTACDESLTHRLIQLLHVRPCLASQAMDHQLGDTIMHRAIHILEQAGVTELQRLGVPVT